MLATLLIQLTFSTDIKPSNILVPFPFPLQKTTANQVDNKMVVSDE